MFAAEVYFVVTFLYKEAFVDRRDGGSVAARVDDSRTRLAARVQTEHTLTQHHEGRCQPAFEEHADELQTVRFGEVIIFRPQHRHGSIIDAEGGEHVVDIQTCEHFVVDSRTVYYRVVAVACIVRVQLISEQVPKHAVHLDRDVVSGCRIRTLRVDPRFLVA